MFFVKKDNKIKVRGNDNIIVNGEGNTIVKDMFFNGILNDLGQNDFISAEQKINRALRIISNSHIDYNWKYDFEMNNNKLHIKANTLDPNAIGNCEQTINVTVNIPEEYSHFKNIEEVIEYGRKRQINIEFEVLDFKLYADNQLVEHRKSDDEGKIILTFPPTPFPVIKCDILINNGELIIPDIHLQITKFLDDDTIEISNKNQPNRCIEFRIISNLKNKNGTINYKIPDDKDKNVLCNLTFLKLLKLSNERFCFKFLTNDGLVLFDWSSLPKHVNINSFYLDLLNDLREIEIEFNIEFEIPDKFGKEDIKAIKELSLIISKGRIEGSVSDDIDFSIEIQSEIQDLKKVAEDNENNNNGLKFEAEEIFELFGNQINVGKVEFFVTDASLKDANNLLKKLELAYEGEIIKLKFTPSDTCRIIKLYRRFNDEKGLF